MLVPVIFVVVGLAYSLLLGLGVMRLLHPEIRRILVVLTAIELVLAGLYVTGVLEAVPFWRWLLDPIDGEKNAVALFASLQLMGISLTALFNGVVVASNYRVRLYWLAVVVVFAFMSVDEYFALHEGFYNWEYVYGGVGLLLVGGSVLLFQRYLRDRMVILGLVVSGLAFMAAGGILVEDVVVKESCFYWVTPFEECLRLQVFEEFFEMAGGTLVLVGALRFARRGLSPARFRILRRRVQSVLVVWLVVLLANFWVQPMLEARLLARQVSVQYLDGALELIGYRVSSRPVISRAAGTWRATLYWRANAPLQAEYGLSLHFLTYPEVASIAQNDVLLLNPPHPDWLPGQVIKQVVDLEIPAGVEAPRNYWLTVTLWQRPWDDYNTIPIAETDQRLLTPEIVILEDFPFQ